MTEEAQALVTSGTDNVKPRAWLTAALAVASCSALLGSLLVYGWPANWTTVGIFAALVLLATYFTVEMLISRLAISPGLVLILAAVSALPPHGRVTGAMLLGACDGLDWKRLRAGRFQTVTFNTAQLMLACFVAALTYQELAHLPLVVVLTATSLSYLVVNAALVLPAAAVQSGQPISEMLRAVRTSTVTELAFGVIGLFLGRLYHSDGSATLVLILAPAVIAQAVLSSVIRYRHAYERLESLYEFTRELEASRSELDPTAAMLHHVCRRLGVESASVVTSNGRSWQRIAVGAGHRHVERESHLGDLPPSLRVLAPVLLDADPVPGGHTPSPEHDAGMAAPLRIEGRLIGSLSASRSVSLRELGTDDLRLLQTLANHVAVFLDRNDLVDRLRHDSLHDRLTGLPNRHRFADLIGDAPKPAAILLVDLDRFKEVNDTLGHDQGDLLLVAVAERLANQFRGSTVARLGGDEFGILLCSTSLGDAQQAAVALLTGMEQPYPVGELQLEITASVGLALAEPEDDAAKLLQQADVAMYTAKEAHSGWEMYSPSRDHHSPWRLSLASDLRRGITDGELEVHYQPKAPLLGGGVSGMEALVRWRHPRYGLLSPDQFIAVAEHAGLIRSLTMAVLSAACEQHTRLRDLGFDLGIAVNVSVRSVLDVNLPDQVADVLAAHGVTPGALTLEITEGSLMADPGRTIGVLGRLAAIGIALSIDDFGTGFSSLGYLRRLPATEVKIDRSFVSGLTANASDEAIVRSTVELAHNLGLRAVAEGIEDPATWNRLASLGCDEGQGYFLSAPLAPAALLPWLLRTRSAEPRP